MKSLYEKHQAKTINNVSVYLTARPQDKFLPAHSTPITCTGLNTLTNSPCLLPKEQRNFFIFQQRTAIRYQAIKKKSFLFLKKPETLQRFLENNELLVYYCI